MYALDVASDCQLSTFFAQNERSVMRSYLYIPSPKLLHLFRLNLVLGIYPKYRKAILILIHINKI
jgi:hypothetical protein